MNAPVFRIRRSLKRELLVPLLLIGAALAAVTVCGIYAKFQQRINEQGLNRAELVANAVNYAAESVAGPGELQRIVGAIGAEKDVKLIAVVGGQPARVLAATRNAWLGLALTELPDREMGAHLEKTIQTRRSHYHAHIESDRFDLASPLLLSRPDLADKALTSGAVIVSVDLAARQAAIARVSTEFSLAFLAALGVIGALGYGLVHHFVLRPISRIGERIEHRREADGKGWAEALFDDELGALARTLDDSLTRTDAALRELQLSRDSLALATSSARIGIWDWDVLANKLVWDAQMYALYGIRAQDFSGAYDAWQAGLHPDDRERGDAAINAALNGEQDFNIEFRVLWPNGEMHDIEAHALVQRADDGSAKRMIGVNWDITERKQVEERIRRLNEELEARVAARTAEVMASNKQLEEFAYVASHDLQEPLRMVASYMQLIEQRLAGKLDAETRRFMGFAVDGARRMQNMIQDILAYSRVNTQGAALAPVDSAAALKDALALLAGRIAETGAAIEAQALPVVMADRTQLMQLFENLIDNAIKFCKDRPPRVRIEARREGRWWRFAVTDNGIGIAPGYRAQLFVIFKRLHTRREYPGTGIGLVICKRIVERHGGEIGIESAPDGGSTFWFTLQQEQSP